MRSPGGTSRTEAGEPRRIVTYGTSLTAEYSLRFWRRSGGAWVRGLRSRLARHPPGPLEVRNRALWGADSVWGLAKLEPRVLALRPDLLLLEFAINDADERRGIPLDRARDNLERMIGLVLDTFPRCRIFAMTMSPPLGRHREVRPAMDDYYRLYRDVAVSRGVGLIDIARRWAAIKPENLTDYIPDGIHPNAAAAREIILPAILEAFSIDRDTFAP